MNHRSKLLRQFTLQISPLVLPVLALLACGGGGAADAVTSQAALDSVAVTPTSLTLQVGATQPLAVAAFADGQPVSGVTTAFVSLNPAVADVDGAGVVRAVGAGAAVVAVAVTRDGVTRTVNVAVSVSDAGGPGPAPPGGSSSATVTTPGNSFSPPTVTIAPGGSVTWQIAGATHNVTFNAAQPAGGNVPNTQSGGSATRTFPNAGTYPYECTLHSNMTGAVIVQTAGGGGGGGGGQTPAAVVSVTANEFSPDDVRIAPGASVLWVFSGATNNVTFENAQPPGGNIPDTAPGTSVSRTFPVAGDYEYESTRTPGMKGRIRVR